MRHLLLAALIFPYGQHAVADDTVNRPKSMPKAFGTADDNWSKSGSMPKEWGNADSERVRSMPREGEKALKGYHSGLATQYKIGDLTPQWTGYESGLAAENRQLRDIVAKQKEMLVLLETRVRALEARPPVKVGSK